MSTFETDFDQVFPLQGGSYHQIIPSGDMSAGSSYTTNGNLKSQFIDYWDHLSSKSKVKGTVLYQLNLR